MKILATVQWVGRIIISIGVGAIMTNLIKMSLPGTKNIIVKMFMLVGGSAIAGILALEACDRWDSKMEALGRIIKILEALSEEETTEQGIEA